MVRIRAEWCRGGAHHFFLVLKALILSRLCVSLKRCAEFRTNLFFKLFFYESLCL